MSKAKAFKEIAKGLKKLSGWPMIDTPNPSLLDRDVKEIAVTLLRDGKTLDDSVRGAYMLTNKRITPEVDKVLNRLNYINKRTELDRPVRWLKNSSVRQPMRNEGGKAKSLYNHINENWNNPEDKVLLRLRAARAYALKQLGIQDDMLEGGIL
jgi:hypothetical protein